VVQFLDSISIHVYSMSKFQLPKNANGLWCVLCQLAELTVPTGGTYCPTGRTYCANWLNLLSNRQNLLCQLAGLTVQPMELTVPTGRTYCPTGRTYCANWRNLLSNWRNLLSNCQSTHHIPENINIHHCCDSLTSCHYFPYSSSHCVL